MRQNARGALVTIGCTLLALGALPARAADTGTPTAVTAHPPLEAVPATPGGHASQSRLRHCAAAARTKHLTGAAREAYLKNCTAERHSSAAKPVR